jgi:hypothetical protein
MATLRQLSPHLSQHPLMPSMEQISGLAKELAPMVATMVARELLKDKEGPGKGPHKQSTRRGSRLKQAVKLEREADTPEDRSGFLVSAPRRI